MSALQLVRKIRLCETETAALLLLEHALATRPEAERCCQHSTPGLPVCRFMLEACERGDYRIEGLLPK